MVERQAWIELTYSKFEKRIILIWLNRIRSVWLKIQVMTIPVRNMVHNDVLPIKSIKIHTNKIFAAIFFFIQYDSVLTKKFQDFRLYN